MMVGARRTGDPDVCAFDHDHYRSAWARMWLWSWKHIWPRVKGRRGAGWLESAWLFLGQPRRWLDRRQGREDFRFPQTWHVLQGGPNLPHVLHGHNLHGDYFDLRALPWLSRQLPVILTLHDAWLLSGHCAHGLDCLRWKTGCGDCPDLALPPAIRRDATAFNWQRKKDLYANCRFYVATPSHWLMDKVRQSMLAPAIREARVIPNGIDLLVFQPGDKLAARRTLGLPRQGRVVLFAAHGIRNNVWKDYLTLREAVGRLGKRCGGEPLVFLALGEDGPSEQIGSATLRFAPSQKQPEDVARYYQAADLYVHAARVDTFPNTVLEALASGVPVAATAVGGIVEQLRSLRDVPGGVPHLSTHGPPDATGALVPPSSSLQLAAAMQFLLAPEQAGLLKQLADNAFRDAQQRYDRRRMAMDYLSWYAAILGGTTDHTDEHG
jgi:glycosyltransferase involved in cell wall biosynthesis